MLKLVIEKEAYEVLEEPIQALYKERADGKFALTVEGAVEKEKLDEFRTNNIKLAKDLENLQEKYKDIDPGKFAEMTAKLQEIEDQNMIDAGKVDELVEQKVERMKADFEGQKEALELKMKSETERADKAESHLAKVLIDSEVTKAVTGVGNVKQGALEDIIVRGRNVWELVEGKPMPMTDGKVMYGKDGQTPLTFGEWAEGLQKAAPFLFEDSAGGGAAGGGGGARGDSNAESLKKLPPAERLKEMRRKEQAVA